MKQQKEYKFLEGIVGALNEQNKLDHSKGQVDYNLILLQNRIEIYRENPKYFGGE